MISQTVLELLTAQVHVARAWFQLLHTLMACQIAMYIHFVNVAVSFQENRAHPIRLTTIHELYQIILFQTLGEE